MKRKKVWNPDGMLLLEESDSGQYREVVAGYLVMLSTTVAAIAIVGLIVRVASGSQCPSAPHPRQISMEGRSDG